jgi:hypothetical protein
MEVKRAGSIVVYFQEALLLAVLYDPYSEATPPSSPSSNQVQLKRILNPVFRSTAPQTNPYRGWQKASTRSIVRHISSPMASFTA